MMKQLIIFLALVFCTQNAFAQERQGGKKSKHGVLYFSFGTHRTLYSPSTVRFVSNSGSYDFTLEKLRGRDDGGIKLETSPHYQYNIGYYSYKKKIGIEFHFDHIKYFMRQNQVARLSGRIGTEQYDQDTMVHGDFVKLEHTDGGNYAMFNVVKWKNLSTSRDQKRSLDLVMKAGAGAVIPKTNSTIMGVHNDDKYAISGFVLGIEPGIRYQFLKHVFAIASFKGAYANYTRFRIADGHGSQQWLSGQINLMLGVQVPM